MIINRVNLQESEIEQLFLNLSENSKLYLEFSEKRTKVFWEKLNNLIEKGRYWVKIRFFSMGYSTNEAGFLRDLTNLKSLVIQDIFFDKIEDLHSFNSLISLVISTQKKIDIHELSTFCPNICNLVLDAKIKNIDSINNFLNIEFLQLSGKIDIISLSTLNKLQYLTLFGLIININIVNKMQNLKGLTLYSNRNETHLDFSGCSNLEYLTLYGCSNLETINDLSNLQHLKYLSFEKLKNLKNVDFLKNCKYLEQFLYSGNYFQPQDFYFLKQMPNLKTIQVDFKTMKDLEEFYKFFGMELKDISKQHFHYMPTFF